MGRYYSPYRRSLGPYTLRVRFDDGANYRFPTGFGGGLYGPLQDRELFDQVRIDTEVHTLVWPNGADFDPATLHVFMRPAMENGANVEDSEAGSDRAKEARALPGKGENYGPGRGPSNEGAAESVRRGSLRGRDASGRARLTVHMASHIVRNR
jgi:hypothetical protein